MFGGSTTGSRTHRSRYGNVDERRCLFVRPSVVLNVFRIKMTVIIRTARSSRHDNICVDDKISSFVFWQRDIDQTADNHFEYLAAIFQLLISDDLERMMHCKENVINNNISSCGSDYHCRFESQHP